jgi:hypothetical protein
MFRGAEVCNVQRSRGAHLCPSCLELIDDTLNVEGHYFTCHTSQVTHLNVGGPRRSSTLSRRHTDT